jgi:hypothetical protein
MEVHSVMVVAYTNVRECYMEQCPWLECLKQLIMMDKR